MALNASGPISLGGSTAGASIALELGLSPTDQISLNDTLVRTLAEVPSGAIIMPTNFYGKLYRYPFNQTISSNTANYNIKSAALSGGWNGTTPLAATITINAGVYVYSAATGAYALQTGVTFPANTTLALTNNGIILGCGGAGGFGRSILPGYALGPVGSGAAGGPAMLLQQAISITNNGVISGGGGGGGGGTYYES